MNIFYKFQNWFYTDLIPWIINFFSNHFETLLAVNIFFYAVFALAVILYRLDILVFTDLKKFINNALFYLLGIGQILMVFLLGYLFWVNYQRPSPVKFEDRIIYNTHWVDSSLPIYFILGKELMSVRANGREFKKIFAAGENIREYHFSPDGKFLLIVTEDKLTLLNRQSSEHSLIESLFPEGKGEGLHGVIQNVQWGPRSFQFCFESAKWSKYGSRNLLYVYDIRDKSKAVLHTPAKEVSSLAWDIQGENLYFTQFEAMDTSKTSYPYEVKIYKISLAAKTPELIEKVPYKEPQLPVFNLHLRNIQLFTATDELSFGRAGNKQNEWVAPEGPRIGIDEDDHLYYIKSRWWRKRLYPLSRHHPPSDIPRYQHGPGILSVENIKWFPGAHYVAMEHYSWGILILEPSSGKVGRLMDVKGKTFGWYPGDVRKK